MHNLTLAKIVENNKQYHRDEVKNIIVLYEEPVLFIGDSIIRIHYLAGLKVFFPNAKVTMNFVNKDFAECYHALIQNNPNLDILVQRQWAEIPFESYDMVICLIHEELNLLKHLHVRYGEEISNGKVKMKVFSISKELISNGTKIVVSDGNYTDFIFPKFEEFVAFFENTMEQNVRELYIMEEEREWANSWLKEKGLAEDENLFIMVDSASKRDKLMAFPVYSKFLKYLLSLPKSKILIFDEKNIGKKEFYKAVLGETLESRIIYSEANKLRQDLSLISAHQVKIIFGPCTGLLHCASGIYNHLSKKGIKHHDIPIIVTYTGKYNYGNRNANHWWNNSPLVDCLLLRSVDGKSEVAVLNELTTEERDREDNQVECEHYTTQMFIDFMSDRLAERRYIDAIIEK